MAKQVLTDGYQTLLEIDGHADIKMTIISITPPGVDGGGEIDVTTMESDTWRERMPKALKTLTESTMTVAYDPEIYDEIVDIINVNKLMTITFPNGDTVAFWGWLNTFNPGEHQEGERPTAECNVIPSNLDDSLAPVAPVWTASP